MTFADLNLNTQLLDALDSMQFTTPTTIQQKAFSVIMSGADVCGIAQTGTGKTLAFLLPLLRMHKYNKDHVPTILIVVPTRELVVQVVEQAKKLSEHISVEVVGAYGGANMKPQAAAIQNGADIIVATPGRLLDLLYDGIIKPKHIKKLVIDEMDEMLNLGFRTQMNNILDMLPEKRQNLLFSATITDEVEALLDSYFNNPVRIEAAPAGTPLENIMQIGYHVPNFYTKANLLELLLERDETMSKVLVFVSTKSLADKLFEEMNLSFPEKVGVMHSNKDQNYRFNTVNKFKDGTYRFIIATDLIARGLDISEVTHVVNFDTPDVPENYIHRIGRTGRADKKGIAITFITEKEKEYLEPIQALMKYEVPIHEMPSEVEISDVLIDEEKPKVHMKTIQIKLPSIYEGGGAFHEKLAKNKKVNKKVRHADKMKEKYGKPKSRGKKR